MKRTSKTLEIEGKKLTLETGELASQATAAVVARLGDTMVISTVVMGEESKLDYFPLSVEYVERLYAGGRIKGSRWVKREGRPSDDAILTARLIDRSIRPLFPKDLKREVQVIVTVLSVDGENEPDILGIIATSAALAISKIPWKGPIGASRVGFVGEENGENHLLMNPHTGENAFLTLDMVVSSGKEKVVMIEAGADQISERIALQAVQRAKEQNNRIIDLINEMVAEVGEPKIPVIADESYKEMVSIIEKSYKEDIKKLIEAGVNKEVGSSLNDLADRIYILESTGDKTPDMSLIKKTIDYIFKKTIRQLILKEGKRPDKRGIDEIRPLSARVSVLPRTHGSAIFSRGETQVLSVATLGTPTLSQAIEGPEGEEIKRYMHHYSFPPYSVGETGRIGSPNRREIGHGALAERALEPVIPSESEFPYAIRVVSEVMSSNGSTSQASVCGSTLALMDAGVPLKAPVAGIAMGLMTDGDQYTILTDIMGLEDFSGDMDFKIAGTEKGITAIQLDVKIDGLTDEIIQKTYEKARAARLFILEKMLSTIPESRRTVSEFAPKIKMIKINPEKIGEVIGSGGRTIKNIIATTGATVDVEDDGSVTISAVSEEAVEKAAEWVSILARELQKGEIFEGTVRRIMPFGAFVEIVPGKEGLVHVSEMSTEYVTNPSDIVTIGQKVKVNVKEIDDQGRLNLSMIFGERPERPAGPRPPREDRYSQTRRTATSSGPRNGGFGRRSLGSMSTSPDRSGGFRKRRH